MSALHRLAVAARRLGGRHPWVHWLLVGAVALAAAASIHDRVRRLDAEREAWGETRAVWVTSRAVAAGDTIVAVPRDVPVAMLPDHPAIDVDGLVARHPIGSGEIVTDVAVAVDRGPASLVPDGWLAVPVVESPRVGAAVGEHVQAASEGFVIAPEALVVAVFDDVTLVAAPPDAAPLIAAAADAGTITLLLDP